MRRLILISVACGAFGPTLIARVPTAPAVVEPRSEIVSILEEEVMSVVFRTDRMTFTAQRSRPGAAFAVQITYADGRPARQCLASSDLGGRLAAYSTLTAERPLASQQQAEKDFPVLLGTFELRDRIDTEPVTAIRLRASADRKRVAALYETVAAEVTHPEGAFSSLENGCDALGGRPAS